LSLAAALPQMMSAMTSVPFGLVRRTGRAASPQVAFELFFVAAKVLNRLQLSLTIARIY